MYDDYMYVTHAELPEVIREMRKEKEVYKSKKKTAKGGLRENQVCSGRGGGSKSTSVGACICVCSYTLNPSRVIVADASNLQYMYVHAVYKINPSHRSRGSF